MQSVENEKNKISIFVLKTIVRIINNYSKEIRIFISNSPFQFLYINTECGK